MNEMKYPRLIMEFLTMMLSMHEIPPPMREREILLHSAALGHLVHRRKRERHFVNENDPYHVQ